MNHQNPVSKDIQPLLSEAAKKLGIPPEQLAAHLQNGDLSRAMQNMPPSQQQMLKKTLSDKNACERLMNSPQAQALIKKLSGK
ncbi:hypothetical protein [uncultured Ruminococcus sp.]|uniref:hypothetical protein n=1 Tax=uncultured Ruminococcus sp. TaxID=165186 RepID=UPI000EBC1C38|nr:hypothetical protein [uncultured Ruminococcus sp.]HCJ42230.1 hypothetical protein [Ruminococcus sp.]